MRGIGYYVHHQGAGHRERARRIAEVQERPCTLIGTFDGTLAASVPVLDLPDDRLAEDFDSHDGERTRPVCLHYAPLGHAGIRERMAIIAAWIERTDPVLMIVDVSVEVALFARLLSVPTLYVRLAGTRGDPPHREAFRAAERLIAPFPEALDAPDVPDWVREKTVYAGFLVAPVSEAMGATEGGSIAVVFGRGGAGGDFARLVAAARAVPDREWHVLGPVAGANDLADPPPNLHLHGWVEDAGAHLAAASLVVGGCGDGLLAAVASAGKRFVCLPEPRPFGEQACRARALARLGAAVTHEGWPEAGDWPGLVARGLALDPAALAGLHDPDAVGRLARTIDGVAQGIEARRRS